MRQDALIKIVTTMRTICPEATLKVWDNSPNSSFPRGIADELYQSSVNLSTSPRWWLASQSQTEYVAVIDDDLMVKKESFIEKCLQCLNNGYAAVGPYGVVLNGSSYSRSLHCFGTARPVDIIKGRFFMTKTQSIRLLHAVPPFSEDDIIVSAYIEGKCCICTTDPDELLNIPGHFALSDRPDHMVRRDAAVRKYLRDKAF